MYRPGLFLGLSFALIACAGASEISGLKAPQEAAAATPAPLFSADAPLTGTTVTGDRLALAPQPGLQDLDAWAAAGVTTVVNMRSRQETADLGFDERAEVEARGMTYVEIPMGGQDGVSPDIVEALGLTLDTAEVKVVLHCRSGTRAAHAYGALKVKRGELAREDLDQRLGWTAPLSPATLDALLTE